jgi:hypothetical protein
VDVVAVHEGRTKLEVQRLMEAVLSKANMSAAYKRVKQNQGAPGVEGMTTEATNSACYHSLNCASRVSDEPPYAEPHVRWCERGGFNRPYSMREAAGFEG